MFVVGAKKTKETGVVFLTEAKNFLAIAEVVMVVDINNNYCQGQFVEARFLLAVLFHYFNNEKANKAAFSTIFLKL